jgi:hypothetical protein
VFLSQAFLLFQILNGGETLPSQVCVFDEWEEIHLPQLEHDLEQVINVLH